MGCVCWLLFGYIVCAGTSCPSPPRFVSSPSFLSSSSGHMIGCIGNISYVGYFVGEIVGHFVDYIGYIGAVLFSLFSLGLLLLFL